MKIKILSLTLLSVLWITSFVSVPQVYACSGGGSDHIELLLERTDYAIKADVVSVDAVRQNAVLAVDSYLFGGAGPEYLVFLQTDPVIVTRVTEGDPNGSCKKPFEYSTLDLIYRLSKAGAQALPLQNF